MKRTLTLKREALTELSRGDLQAVVAAQQELSGASCPKLLCVNLSDLFVVTTCGCQTSPCA